jgi:hypothetical protein
LHIGLDFSITTGADYSTVIDWFLFLVAFSITYIGSLSLLAMSMVEVGLCSVSGGMSSLFFLNDVPCSKGRTNWRESDMTSGASL